MTERKQQIGSLHDSENGSHARPHRPTGAHTYSHNEVWDETTSTAASGGGAATARLADDGGGNVGGGAHHATGEIALILELCKGDALLDRLNREHAVGIGWHEARAALYVRKMLLAVRFCHDHGIVHRDLKVTEIILVL
jgi:serine/threonine protein kinase